MQASTTSKPSTEPFNILCELISFLDVVILPSDAIAHCNALYFNLVSVWIVFCNVSACAVKSVNWRAPDIHTICNRDETESFSISFS